MRHGVPRRSTALRSGPVSTRDRILRAGVQQFQANGYHGTGVAATELR